VTLVERIVAVHRSLRAAGVPHAFGGALALAWCTQQARGTIDIDVNLFVVPDHVSATLAGLPQGLVWGADDVALLERDGQARLWWDTTPVDVFFSTTEFHERAAERTRWEPLGGEDLPFLACRDLAVFKAFFNRTKDWADIEEMEAVGALDHTRVLGVLADHLGGDDARIERLRALWNPRRDS
jgi:hypothetical protein